MVNDKLNKENPGKKGTVGENDPLLWRDRERDDWISGDNKETFAPTVPGFPSPVFKPDTLSLLHRKQHCNIRTHRPHRSIFRPHRSSLIICSFSLFVHSISPLLPNSLGSIWIPVSLVLPGIGLIVTPRQPVQTVLFFTFKTRAGVPQLNCINNLLLLLYRWHMKNFFLWK